MPKQIWRTFDGEVFDDEATAIDHEDKAFAAAIDSNRYCLDILNAASVDRTFWDYASDDEEAPATHSERDIVERVMRRCLIS